MPISDILRLNNSSPDARSRNLHGVQSSSSDHVTSGANHVTNNILTGRSTRSLDTDVGVAHVQPQTNLSIDGPTRTQSHTSGESSLTPDPRQPSPVSSRGNQLEVPGTSATGVVASTASASPALAQQLMTSQRPSADATPGYPPPPHSVTSTSLPVTVVTSPSLSRPQQATTAGVWAHLKFVLLL